MEKILILILSTTQVAAGNTEIFDERKGKCLVDNGAWSSWREWSMCSSSCGNDGIRTRKRLCKSPTTTNGQSCLIETDQQIEQCNRNRCPVKLDYYKKYWRCFFRRPIHGEWSNWNVVQSCNSDCGGAIRYSYRKCDSPKPNFCGRFCGKHNLKLEFCPVHGGWGAWTTWSSCTVTCDSNGDQTRTRVCNDPTPKYDGNHCKGVNSEVKGGCNNINCPVDGGWGEWTSFSSCTVTCGSSGLRTRTRLCDNPAPIYNGKQCAGDSTESAGCNYNNCPISGDRYLIYSNSVPWNSAKVECENKNAHLVTIDNENENEFLFQELKKMKIEYAFIGLQKLSQAGTYKWTDGTYPSYENWMSKVGAEQYPGDGSGHACAVLWVTSLPRQWQAIACNGQSSTAYICEKK